MNIIDMVKGSALAFTIATGAVADIIPKCAKSFKPGGLTHVTLQEDANKGDAKIYGFTTDPKTGEIGNFCEVTRPRDALKALQACGLLSKNAEGKLVPGVCKDGDNGIKRVNSKDIKLTSNGRIFVSPKP